MDDPYHLVRFIDAQDDGGTYQRALQELVGGHKRSHWMWFIFPQIAGLGQSPTSRRYAISSLDEAIAYLSHPVLGERLLDCARAVLQVENRSAEQIFGSIDAQKLCSSMTLFHRARPAEPVVAQVIDRYFDGRPDAGTDRLLWPPGLSADSVRQL